MPPAAYIETQEQLEQTLQYWRNFSFNKNYINLQDAVDKLDTKDSLVTTYHQYAPRWVVSSLLVCPCHPFIYVKDRQTWYQTTGRVPLSRRVALELPSGDRELCPSWRDSSGAAFRGTDVSFHLIYIGPSY